MPPRGGDPEENCLHCMGHIQSHWASNPIPLHLQRVGCGSFLLEITSFTLTKSDLSFPFSLSLCVLIHTHESMPGSVTYWLSKSFLTTVIWTTELNICNHFLGKLWAICRRIFISPLRKQNHSSLIGVQTLPWKPGASVYTRGRHNSSMSPKYPVGCVFSTGLI